MSMKNGFYRSNRKVYSPSLGEIREFRKKHVTNIKAGKIDLKLISKQLQSGKCQVKFYAKIQGIKKFYGYTLVEPEATLKEVVQIIKTKLRQAEKSDTYHHGHLYSLGKKRDEKSIFMIFKNDSGRTQL